jgi:RNA polymerase sigma-70 factor (ECF subfamily)
MRTSVPDADPAASPSEICTRAFEQEFSFLYWTFRRQGVRPAEAEDLAQEAFLVFWRRRNDLIPGRPLRPWLAGVAFHLGLKHLARRGREAPGVDFDVQDDSPSPDERLGAARDRALAREALARLPDRHRRALVMHEIDDMPMRTLADAWGVPLFTAYTRVRAARKAFASTVTDLQRSSGAEQKRPIPIAPLIPPENDRPAPPAARERVRRRLLILLGFPVEKAPQGRWTTVGPWLGMATLAALIAVVGLRSAPVESRTSEDAVLAKGGAIDGGRQPAIAKARAASLAPPVFVIDDNDELPLVPRSALARGLLGHWSFDPGARLHDRSGNGHDCIERRPYDRPVTPATDDQNATGSATFKRSGWLECAQPDIAGGVPLEMTVATRLRSADLPRSHRAVVARAMEGGQGELFYLGFGGSRLILRSTPWRAKIAFPFPEAEGRWVHLAFTHHRDGTTRLFVDGQEVGVAKGGPHHASPVRTPLIVGMGVKRRPSDGRPLGQFKGDVDEVLVYDRALDPDEIAALSRGTQPAPAHSATAER